MPTGALSTKYPETTREDEIRPISGCWRLLFIISWPGASINTSIYTGMHTHVHTHMHAHKTYHYKILKVLSSSFWSLSLVLYQKNKIIPVFKDEIKSLSLELWGWHSQFWRSSSWKERTKVIGSDTLSMEIQLTEKRGEATGLEHVISSLDNPEISRSLDCCCYQPSTQNCPEYKSLC